MSVNRRDFIGFLAAGTAAGALEPGPFSAELAAVSEKEPEGKVGAGAKPAIDALVFDAYGTLFDVNSVAATGEEQFPGKGQELSQLWRTKQLEYTWLRSLMGKHVDFWRITQDALTFACKRMNLDCSPVQRERLMQSYNRLNAFPDVRPALEGLAPLPLAILSNGSPNMLQAAVTHSGIGELLKHIISIEEAGIYKPDPRVYQLALNRFKVKERRQVGFVSSNCWDAIGAKSFGFTVFWINRSNLPVDELGSTPDRTL